MANEKLTDKAAFPGGGSGQKTDLYHCVVVNDSTGSASGTSTKQTYQQMQDGINLLTEATAIDPDADFLLGYDTSASASGKIHPQYLQVWNVLANSTADITLDITHAGNLLRLSKNSGTQTVTIPNHSSVAFQVGTEILIMKIQSGGTQTIAAAGGVTIGNKDCC